MIHWRALLCSKDILAKIGLPTGKNFTTERKDPTKNRFGGEGDEEERGLQKALDGLVCFFLLFCFCFCLFD